METGWQRIKNNVFLRRCLVLLLIIAFLYETREMMNTILLTFIFTYVIVHLIRFVQRYIPKMPTGLIVVITYLIILALLYFVVTVYVPMLADQVTKMVKSVMAFYESNASSRIMSYVTKYISKKDIMTQAKGAMTVALHTVKSVGTLTIATFMSLILSFFFTFELKQMKSFSSLFIKGGYLKWLFEDVYYFGKKFTNTFGVVLEAQFFIALCNTFLTMIGLAIMKMPQLVALGLMVFILSMVPVAGVIISLIPLSIVGYSVGGVRYVIYIFIMIMIIHAIEAYVLNPKFMASKTELPIFYTFLVLLVAEHFWGTWGLIVGVPIFTFFLDILGIKESNYSKKKAQEN